MDDSLLITLFWRGDPLVRGIVITLLALAAGAVGIGTRGVLSLWRANAQSKRFERRFWSGEDLDELYDEVCQTRSQSVIHRLFIGGMSEYRYTLTHDLSSEPSLILLRVRGAMETVLSRYTARIQRNIFWLWNGLVLSVLLGVLGTLWEMMMDFYYSGDTSAAILTLSEALLSSVLGLLIAIVLFILYGILKEAETVFSRDSLIFIAEFCTLLSRHLEETRENSP